MKDLSATSRRLELGLALLLAPLLSLIFFHFMLRDLPFFRDLHHEFYTMKVFLAGELRQGRVPLWNPTEFMGMPFLAELATGCYYPLNLLFWFLSPVEGLRWLILLHYPWAGLGLYLFLRDLGLRPAAAALAALSFAFSGYLVAQHANLIYLISPCYFPWALFGFRRALARTSLSWALAAGLSVALPFLAGEPQGAALAALIGAAFALISTWRAGNKKVALALLAAAFGFAAGLSMIQFLPSWELSRLTERAAGLPLAEATCWSFYPLRLVELIWPDLWGLPWKSSGYWGSFMTDWCFSLPWSLGLYLGLWPLLAAALAFRRPARGLKPAALFFAVLSALALLMAFGRYTPFFKIAYFTIPGLRWFRYPEKYLALLSLGLAVLAGIGTHQGLEDPKLFRNWRRGILIGLGALVAVAVAGWLARPGIEAGLAVFLQGRGFGHLNPTAAARALLVAQTRSAAAALGLALVLALAWSFPRAAKSLPVLLVLLTGLDLYSANRPLVDTAPAWIYTGPSQAAEMIRRHQAGKEEKFRVFREQSLEDYRGPLPAGAQPAHVRQRLWHKDTLKPNWARAFGLEEITGYSQSSPTRSYTLWEQRLKVATLEAFNVKYALTGLDWTSLDDYPEAETLETDSARHFRLVELRGYLPRAYVVSRARAVLREEDAAAALNQTDFRHEVVLLTSDPLPPAGGDRDLIPARVLDYETDRVEIEVENSQPGWLVLSDSYFPGWEARVNGRLAKIYRANYAVRAVAVGAGASRVVFVYRPGSYRWGRAISGMTLGLGLAALIAAGIKRRRRAPA